MKYTAAFKATSENIISDDSFFIIIQIGNVKEDTG